MVYYCPNPKQHKTKSCLLVFFEDRLSCTQPSQCIKSKEVEFLIGRNVSQNHSHEETIYVGQSLNKEKTKMEMMFVE